MWACVMIASFLMRGLSYGADQHKTVLANRQAHCRFSAALTQIPHGARCSRLSSSQSSYRRAPPNDTMPSPSLIAIVILTAAFVGYRIHRYRRRQAQQRWQRRDDGADGASDFAGSTGAPSQGHTHAATFAGGAGGAFDGGGASGDWGSASSSDSGSADSGGGDGGGGD